MSGELFFVLAIISAKITLDKIMLKDAKLPLNISVMEAITISSFIVIGYLFIYRYSFYNTLGIPWYITTITPAQVFSGSTKVLFNLFFGTVLGFILIKFSNLFEKRKELILLIMMILLSVVWGIILLSEQGVYFLKIQNILDSVELSTVGVIHYVITLLMIRLTIRFGNLLKDKTIIIDSIVVPEKLITPQHKYEKLKLTIKEMMLFNYIFILVVMLLTPIAMGEKDSLYLLKNRTEILNLAIVKDDPKKWFLIELVGDKALLIAENSRNNEFKLIEYKEIQKIIAPPKIDSDAQIINKVKKFVD